VEIIDVLLILGVFLPLLFVGVWQLNKANTGKKAIRAGDNSIKNMYEVYNTQVQDVLKVKDNQIKSLSAKLRSYEEEEEPTVEKEQVADLIKNPEIQKLLQQKGINPQLLDNPIISKYIKKYTKGMSIEQVLEIAQQLGFLKGNKQSQQGAIGAPQEYNPNWA